MPYVFSETPTGCNVTHPRDESVEVSLTLHDTALVVESTRSGWCHGFGLFDYYALAQWFVRELLAPQLDLDAPRWKAAWLMQVTGRRVGKSIHQQWKRLLALADPTVVAVQRAVFAATFRAPEILQDPKLYRDPWVVQDMIAYRAAAIAAAHLEPCERPADHDYPFDEPLVMDEVTLTSYLADKRADDALTASAGDDDRPTYPIELLRNWRGLFSPTGAPYTSLNKTLMRLPRVPSRLLPQLCKIRLERPITNWLELLVCLTHLAMSHAPASEPHHRVFMHARADQIHEALRRVAAYTHNELRPARAQDVALLVQFLSDYPHPHRGTIVGLADKSIAWHRHAQERYQAQTIAAFGGDRATARPPIAVPDTSAIRFLATVADVVAEGAAMGHCIASYAHSAVQGTCYLFHVEYDGEVASVQVGPDGRVVQAFGPRNRRNMASEWGAQALNRWGRQFPPLYKQAVNGTYAIGLPLPPPALLDDIAVPF